MPKSCKNVQYDLRKYVSFFKSMPSLLDGELSSISLLEKYQRATSSGFSWEFLLDGPLSDVPWCEDSPGNNPAICILQYNDTAPNIRIQYQVQVLVSSSPVDYSAKTQKKKRRKRITSIARWIQAIMKIMIFGSQPMRKALISIINNYSHHPLKFPKLHRLSSITTFPKHECPNFPFMSPKIHKFIQFVHHNST